MGKIGKGLVKKQKSNRESSGFITPDKVFNIKEHSGEWTNFAKEAIHKINILPWQLKSDKDIAVLMKGDFHKDKGDWVYSLNYWVHPRVHDQKDVLCLKKCFGQPCAICDEAQKKWDIYNDDKSDANKKAAGALNPKLRSMYNIEILTDKGKGKNAFFESSDYIFEEPLLDKATECEDGAEPVAFYEIDAEEGKIVRFKRPKDQMKAYISFEFRDRAKPISKKLLEGVLRFGELIEVPTPEEVSEFFYNGDFPDDLDDDDEDYEEPDEDTVEEEYEEEVEETVDVEETVEEEPEEEASAGDKPNSCPSKKKFGIEYGDFDACDECPVEKECFKKNKALNR